MTHNSMAMSLPHPNKNNQLLQTIDAYMMLQRLLEGFEFRNSADSYR